MTEEAGRRVVAWYSCGITSAVAAKLALGKWGSSNEVVIAYCDTRSEHPDNERFMSECEEWYGREIVRLHSEEYEDTWDVFERARYLAGVKGARCTTELKKNCRRDFQRFDDIQVFGFDAGEAKRIEKFRANNHEIDLRVPLMDTGLDKDACAAIVLEQGIEVPMMYRLGYRNNNCIGCPKGQQGYWNKIRVDFPDVFDRMARVERSLDVAINKRYVDKGKPNEQRIRVFLDELDPNAGNIYKEPDFKCGLSCGSQDEEV